jgi:ubiquinone/menaquinone biosynthesis C-methylase UbiE
MRINLGCGKSPTEGWVNYDNSPRVRFRIGWGRNAHIRYANALRLPHPDNSVDVIYSSHMLEHLDRSQANRFMREALRVLIPGGILRLAVPDLKKHVDAYCESGDADAFLERMLVCVPFDRLKTALVGPRHHLWMYDAKSLTALLTQAGFVRACSLPAGETIIPDPGALNLREREDESVYVEATAR